MKLATFDIFDTCLIRKCGSPDVVPYLVAKRLWPEDEMAQHEYIIARKQAAQKAGSNSTIKDIYSQEPLQCLPDYSSVQIMQSEMELEADLLVPNHHLFDLEKLGELFDSVTLSTLINLLQKEGWSVKFLSDMYLPSDFLEGILMREGFISSNSEDKIEDQNNFSQLSSTFPNFPETVIVSCEWKARKDTGELYKKVREKYQPSEWIHFGDNRHSDIKQAKKNGVKAFRVDTSYTPIEKRIQSLGINSRHPETCSQLAGVMRYARLTSPSQNVEGVGVRLEDIEGAVSLAADYIAPLYIPYVAYVLNQAKKNNIKRLYFLSRDGYIMHEIAKALEPQNIELKYLFVSRKSLLPAYISSTENPKEAFLKITDRQHLIGRKVDFLLSQLQIDSREIRDRFGITFNFTKILNKKQQDEFLDKIFNHPQFTPWLISQLEEKSKLVLSYLIQEGLTVSAIGGDAEKVAMVDIGWLGTTRMMVNSFLAPRPPKGEKPPNPRRGNLKAPLRGDLEGLFHNSHNFHIPTFYLGVRGDVYPSKYGPFDFYFPLGALSTDATGLIENYYSASPWPSTRGYGAPQPPKGEEPPNPRRGNLKSPLRGDLEGLFHNSSNSHNFYNFPYGKIGPDFGDEDYRMTPVIQTNIEVVTKMAKELKPYLDDIGEEKLFNWAKTTVDSLSTMEFPVDLSPMAASSEFDGVPMVKKLSLPQLFDLVFWGNRVTAFDIGSLAYTVGFKISKPLWKIHEKTGRLRSLMYRVLLLFKSW